MDIKDFLLARIAEDEALANAAIATDAPDRWENPTTTGNHWPENIAFWDRATPDRVLAECAAKRAIIEAHATYVAAEAKEDHSGIKLLASGMAHGVELALRPLAAVYNDHPDYQHEWSF